MSVALDLCLQVEREFQELKKAYTLFFSDVVNVEPYELREALTRRVKRLRNLSNLRTEERFRSSNLIAKVQSHFQLWDRQLERKYAGREAQKRKPRTKAKPPPPEQKHIMISDVKSQREKVVELYDEYMRLNLLLGGRRMINFSKFQNFIDNQTRKIRDRKGIDRVRYEVTVQDQKVIIKSKSGDKS